MLCREVELLDRFEVARAAGFDGVEIQFPYSESADDLAQAARAAGMPVVLINTPVSREHPFGLCGRPEMREGFRAQLAQIVEYAEALNVRFVHVLAGQIISSDERDRCHSTYAENLHLAADMLAPYGVDVLVEPLNAHDVPNYLVGSIADAQAILERCEHRAGLQFDLYHVARMGLDPAAELGRWRSLVRHVQFADSPGRHEPGTGNVDFESALAALHEIRYSGWLAAEYVPLMRTPESLAWLEAWRRFRFATEK